jgi:hypothetical protein
MVRRPLKPFSVEVKRGRNGAASGAPAFLSKLERHAAPAVEKRPATPPPEPAKPQRRILEAIVIEPDPEPAAAEAPVTLAALFAEPVKPRRGRPPKVARAPKPAERPILVARNESPAITYPRREVAAVAEPAARAKHAPGGQSARGGNRAPAEFSTHGHVDHAERVEEATGLPRGERWKRRLPKVLW